MQRMRTATAVGRIALVSMSMVVLSLVAAVARAQTQSINLRQAADGTVALVTPPESVPAGQNVTVICQSVDCQQLRANVGPTVLTPSAVTAQRVTFSIVPEPAPTARFELRLCPTATGSAACLKTEAVGSIPVGAAQVSASDPAAVRRFCAQVGVGQTAEIFNRRGTDDFTVVIFDESGPCYSSRQFGAEGDPIAVGFIATSAVPVLLDLDPCNTLGAAPKVLVSADVSGLTLQADEAGRFVMKAHWFQPLRRCFGAAAGIRVTVGTGQAAKAVSYSLKQFERYRATLQIGIAASELHEGTFGLRPDGSAKRVIATSAPERGPEYIGSVVLYGLPHYFRRRSAQAPSFIEQPRTPGKPAVVAPGAAADAPAHEPYFGRDPVNENGAMDRVGLLLGAGIAQPGRRFVAGASVELLTGVNLFVAREFYRRRELEGVGLGDEFTGEAATIPARDHWRQAWTAGLSLDARYALALFGRK